MPGPTIDDDERYFTELASAFVRGRLPELKSISDDAAVIAKGLAAGLRLHKFKRNSDLPRVKRVIGVLHGLAPDTLLDIGSGRGTFLWPLLDAFPELTITAIDKDERRATDLDAVTRGGIARLTARRADAESLDFPARSFDVVTLLEVLEHMPNPERALSHAVRVAGRSVVASVPSKEDDNPEHIHLFDETALRMLFKSAKAKNVRFEHVRGHIVAIASVS